MTRMIAKLLMILAVTFGYSAVSFAESVQQILIEARVVDIDTAFEDDIGVRFGLSDTRPLSGALAISADERLNFNLPTATLFDTEKPINRGLALTKVGRLFLDMELLALESEHHVAIVSRPRFIISNLQAAMIKAEEVPALEVTPQITSENKIMLKLKAVLANQSDINTQVVESNVVLSENETIVLGNGTHNEKHERLIFITPKIIKGGADGKIVHTASSKNMLNSKLYIDQGES